MRGSHASPRSLTTGMKVLMRFFQFYLEVDCRSVFLYDLSCCVEVLYLCIYIKYHSHFYLLSLFSSLSFSFFFCLPINARTLND